MRRLAWCAGALLVLAGSAWAPLGNRPSEPEALDARASCGEALDKTGLTEEDLAQFAGPVGKIFLQQTSAARASFEKGEFAAAAAVWRAARTLTPALAKEAAPGMYARAVALSEQGKVLDAFRLRRRVLKIDPGFADAKRYPHFYGPAKSKWPMFGGGPKHAFYDSKPSPLKDPNALVTGWYNAYRVVGADGRCYDRNSFTMLARDEFVLNQSAIAADGMVYVPAFNVIGLKRLTAVDPEGKIAWKIDLPGSSKSGYPGAPTIASDGTIYVTSGGTLYALTPEGKVKWTFAESFFAGCPAIADDGTLYVIGYDDMPGSWLVAVASDGKLKWKSKLNGHPSPEVSTAIGPDGSIYIGDSSGALHAFLPDGRFNWRTDLKAGAIVSTAAIDPEGAVYVYAASEVLCALNRNGHVEWKTRLPQRMTYAEGGRATRQPVINAEKNICFRVLDEGGRICVIGPDGGVLKSPW